MSASMLPRLAARTLSKRALHRPLITTTTTTITAGTPRAFSTTPRHRAKLYTKQHEWIEFSADRKTATVGITGYASSSLGDVVYVELPTAPQAIAAGDAIGAVESVKSASDIYAPVGGRIVEANARLGTAPGLVNSSPEGEGWIARIELDGGGGGAVAEGGENGELMSEGEYRAFTLDGAGDKAESVEAEDRKPTGAEGA